MVDVVAGPTTGGVVLAFETARQLGVRSIFAEEVKDAGRDGAARVPARLHHRARGAGAARRRHPDDRRFAAGHAPGRGGARRRDRRRAPSWPIAPAGWPRSARRRRGAATRCAPLAAAAADLRSGPRDLPGLRGRHTAPRPGQHGHRGRGLPGALVLARHAALGPSVEDDGLVPVRGHRRQPEGFDLGLDRRLGVGVAVDDEDASRHARIAGLAAVDEVAQPGQQAVLVGVGREARRSTARRSGR